MGSAEEYPINKAILKIKERKEKKMAASAVVIPSMEPVAEKKFEPKFSLASPTPKIELCEEHGKPLDLVCITTRKRICSKCALFGSHKGNDVREHEDVMTEIKQRTELIMSTYDLLM